MKLNRRLLTLVFSGAVFFGFLTSFFLQFQRSLPAQSPQRYQAQVAFVIDGDTIVLANGQHLRYLGIDAPEDTRHHNCFGHQATLANRRLVNHQQITIQTDQEKYDPYGRLLAYVWRGNIFVNDYLARQGYARLELIPPNLKYARELTQAVQEARQERRGLWGHCSTNYRHHHQ